MPVDTFVVLMHGEPLIRPLLRLASGRRRTERRAQLSRRPAAIRTPPTSSPRTSRAAPSRTPITRGRAGARSTTTASSTASARPERRLRDRLLREGGPAVHPARSRTPSPCTTATSARCSARPGPNRDYMHSATSGGNKTNGSAAADRRALDGGLYRWQTICDRDDGHRAQRHLLLQRPAVHRRLGPALLPIIKPVSDFYADAAAGNLPQPGLRRPAVPGWRRGRRPLGRRASARRHPHRPGVHGRRRQRLHLLAAVPARRDVHQLRRVGRLLRPRLAAIRAGRPLQLATSTRTSGSPGSGSPASPISPYARRGYVSHMTVTHESILKLDRVPLRTRLPEQAPPLRLEHRPILRLGAPATSTRPACRIPLPPVTTSCCSSSRARPRSVRRWMQLPSGRGE